MASRLNLHDELCKTLGSNHVYFQPPPSVQMTYPAIVYSRDVIASEYADNEHYIGRKAYLVTVIDKNPDSSIVDALSLWPYCRYERHYAANNLNHDVFRIYY